MLQAAGVIAGGRAHPVIAGALAAILQPDLCTLELEHSGRSMQGWCSSTDAALLLPAGDDDERRTLLAVHPTLLPEALARLVDLGPRPRPQATAPVGPEDIGEPTRRWRLAAAWKDDEGRPGGGVVRDRRHARRAVAAAGRSRLAGDADVRLAPHREAADAPGSLNRRLIARVEPLTTTRRLSGPFDYLLPDAPVAVGTVVRVPFGHQALDGVVVGRRGDERGAGGQARRADRGAARQRPGRPRRAGAVDRGRVLLHARAGALARAAAARPRAGPALGRAHVRGPRRAAADRPTSGRCSSGCRAPRAAIWRRCGGSRRAGS